MIFSSWAKLQREVRLLREENNELKKLIDEAATQLDEHAHEMMREYIEVMNTVVHDEHRKENDENDEI
jgi:seryl-tRNA synthetase